MAHLFVWLCLKACSSNLEDEFLHFVTICVCEFVWKVSKNKNIFQCFIDGKILAPWLFVCGFSFEKMPNHRTKKKCSKIIEKIPTHRNKKRF